MTGDSGCGKTSLIKAINGLWAYGRGNVVFPEGVKSFYAAQDVKLPNVSLKELVCLPCRAGRIFRRAGRGGAAQIRPWRFHRASWREDACEGKAWDQVLSGGQKQKLVVARILLQQPGLLFLDEATGALDPQAKIAFHQAIKDHCPRVTVISIMHEAVPPKSATGAEFYDSVLSIADGVASKKPLAHNLPAELTTILEQTGPLEQPSVRLPAHPPRGKIAQGSAALHQMGLPQPPPLAVPIRISSPGSTIRPLTKA